METILILGIVFILLLFFPILGAMIYYRMNKGDILNINQDRIRDPRYFGKSFAKLIEKNLDSSDTNEIKLSKKEKYIDVDSNPVLGEEVDNLIVAKEKDFTLKSSKYVNKEIYAGNNLVIDSPGITFRAAYSKGDMILGNDSNVVRWVDALGTLAVYDNCDLGISASSSVSMSIGKNCKFRRLFSPEIYIGQYPNDDYNPTQGKDPRIYRLPVQLNKERNIKYISNENINDEGLVDFSVLSWDNVNVTENIIIQGDIRSHKGVRLCENSVVIGNIFAEKDVILEKNACVLGSVFSQENIMLETGAVIGQKGRICSVIARGKITFKQRNFVFGYISCEHTGEIAHMDTNEDFLYKENLDFKKISNPITHLKFADNIEYDNVDQQGFRLNDDLIRVDIPEKVLYIQKSMFYKCKNLKDVSLPETLSIIDSHSFSGCESLAGIDLSNLLNLREIGISAFENCLSLQKVVIPSTVESIGAAAFSGCNSLTEIIIPRESKLTSISDHTFRGCSNLKTIHLPEGIKNIGTSAFFECDSLESIYLPSNCLEEEGIKTLPQDILHFF